MKINNEFTVHAPIERAWALLTDVEAIAPCMPGAQLTGIRPASDDAAPETYEGKVKVKMGPVVAEYKGTAVFVEKDDTAYRGVIDAKGKDTRGAGNASATITVNLRAEGDSTTVGIDTDLKISGKIAQFGAGMIQEVSEKLLGQFVACLEGKLAAPAEPEAGPDTAPEPTPDAVPEATPEAAAEPEPASLAAGPAATGSASVGADPAAATPAPAPAFPTSDLDLQDVTVPELTTPQRNGVDPARQSTTSTPAPAARREFQATPEPEALDLLELAGGAAVKRLLPVAIAGAAALAAVIYFLVRR